MHHEWIIDVLSDLKSYARMNGMTALADQLSDTALMAAVELANQPVQSRPDTDRGGDDF